MAGKGSAHGVAAREEATTRETGDEVLITERTVELLEGDHPKLRERPGLSLRGRSEPVTVYAPVLAPKHRSSPETGR